MKEHYMLMNNGFGVHSDDMQDIASHEFRLEELALIGCIVVSAAVQHSPQDSGQVAGLLVPSLLSQVHCLEVLHQA